MQAMVLASGPEDLRVLSVVSFGGLKPGTRTFLRTERAATSQGSWRRHTAQHDVVAIQSDATADAYDLALSAQRNVPRRGAEGAMRRTPIVCAKATACPRNTDAGLPRARTKTEAQLRTSGLAFTQHRRKSTRPASCKSGVWIYSGKA